MVEPFILHRAVVTLDVGVLLGRARLNVLDGDVAFFWPRSAACN